MKVQIEFDCDNAAFEGDAASEAARIVRQAANAIERSIGVGNLADFESCGLMDANGNTVGRVTVTR